LLACAVMNIRIRARAGTVRCLHIDSGNIEKRGPQALWSRPLPPGGVPCRSRRGAPRRDCEVPRFLGRDQRRCTAVAAP
jgi:hypothetical protein